MRRTLLTLTLTASVLVLSPVPLLATTEPAAAADGASAEDLRSTALLERVRREADEYQSRQLLKQAMKAQREGRDERAERLYTEALELDPANDAAREGRAAVRDRLGINPDPRDTLEWIAKRNEAAAGRLRYEIEGAVTAARMAVARGEFDEARRRLDMAQFHRDQDPAVFPWEELARLDALISAARLKLHRAEADAKQRELDERNRRTRERYRSSRDDDADADRRGTVADLTRTARGLADEGRDAQALAVVGQIETLDPGNAYAAGARPLLEDRIQVGGQRGHRERYGREWTTSLNGAEERKVPYDSPLLYPDDWPRTVALRDGLRSPR